MVYRRTQFNNIHFQFRYGKYAFSANLIRDLRNKSEIEIQIHFMGFAWNSPRFVEEEWAAIMRIFQLHKTSLSLSLSLAVSISLSLDKLQLQQLALLGRRVRMQHALATRNMPHYKFLHWGLHSANAFWAWRSTQAQLECCRYKIQDTRYRDGNALVAEENEQNRKQLLARWKKESNEIELEIDMKTGLIESGKNSSGSKGGR